MQDIAVSNWFEANNHPGITAVLLVVTHWHSTPGLLLMSAALALVLCRQRSFDRLVLLLATVPGGMMLNAALKQIFRRARPQFDEPLITLTTYSFPSGHAAGATLFYGFLSLLLVSRLHQPSLARRSSILAGAVCMVGMVAISRVYLGAHYLSDVLGGIVVGLLWLASCVALQRRLQAGHAGEPAAHE